MTKFKTDILKTKERLKRSKLFSLNLRDFINGAVMAVLTSVLYFIQQCADQQELVLNWKGIGMAAVSGMAGYLIQKLSKPYQST